MALCSGRRADGSFCTRPVLSDGQRCAECLRRQDEEETERRLLAAAEDANERIRSCHEVVACPKCGAPVGEVCRSMNGGAGYVEGRHWQGKPVKPHEERWTLVQPAR
jgi:hypothetical protein